MEAYIDALGLALLLLPFYMFVKAIYIARTTSFMQRKIVKKNILYVIAHPDDEAM